MYSIGAIGATFFMKKEKKVGKKKVVTQVDFPFIEKPIIHIEPDIGLNVKRPHPIIEKLKKEGITNIYTRTTQLTMLERKDLTKEQKIENTVKIIETMKPENQDKFTQSVISSIIQTDPITQVAVETVIQKKLNLLRTAGFQFGGGM